MLDIAQDFTNQDSRTFKFQKEELKFYEAQSIKNQTRPIKNHRKVNSVDFKPGSNL